MGLLRQEDKKGRDRTTRRVAFRRAPSGIYRVEVARWADVKGHCAVLFDLLTPPFEEG